MLLNNMNQTKKFRIPKHRMQMFNKNQVGFTPFREVKVEDRLISAGLKDKKKPYPNKNCSMQLPKGNLSLTGFTLVEIMIVVAIIAMLAAIAIPNLLYARLLSNEAVAQGTLKTIASACEGYRAADTFKQFPANLSALTTATPSYIAMNVDTATTGIPKNGYNFIFTSLGGQQFVCCAIPDTYRTTGIRTFAINETGLLRGTDNGGILIDTTALYEAMDVAQ